MNWIDKAVAWVSPEAAVKRAQARLALEEYRNYDAARGDRLGSDWQAVNGSGEQADKPYRSLIRRRARHLENNSDMAEAVVLALIRNVVGTGIKPQAKVKNGDKLDEATNKKLEAAWKEFIKPENCDITGQMDFYELQEFTIRRWAYDGEVFYNKVADKKAFIPFMLQGIDPEDISCLDYQSKDGNPIIDGIEVNQQLRPQAYYMYPRDPLGFTNYDPVRIEAKNMIHFWKKTKHGQIRGMSLLARVMQRIHDTDEFLHADMVAARVAACFAGFIEETPNYGGRQLPSGDKPIQTLSPGIIKTLRPGQKISFAEPRRNASSVGDFTKLQSRRTSTGVGLSYDTVYRDIEGNFSAARQNLLEDRKVFVPLQQFVIRHFCRPIWEEFVKACALKGIIPIKEYTSDPKRFYEAQWVTPGWSWIDPEKEVNASKEELKSGIATLAEICGEQGKDWQEVIDQMAVEKAYAKSKGLELDIHMSEALLKAQSANKEGGNGNGQADTGNGTAKQKK